MVWVRAVGSLIVVFASHYLALWLRWGGEVPPHLWGQLTLVAPIGVAGAVIGTSLTDFWTTQRSLIGSIYTAGVISGLTVVFTMAGAYAFQFIKLPRLTSAILGGVLWGALAASDRLWSRLEQRLQDPARAEAIAPPGQILVQRLMVGGRVVLIPGAEQLLLASARLLDDGDRLLLEVSPRGAIWPSTLLKRAADVFFAFLGIVVTSPLWLVLAIAIALDSPGPVFFRQPRVGWRGTVFTLLKFRTMVADAESETGPTLTRENDPRLTRVGRWLRSLRLDELPQLLNVLRGDMSLIGPRPERPEFVEQFRRTIEGYDLRHLVKPGITGLAQIRGRYDTPAEDKLRYDLAYIFLWSPLLDLKIMLQTLGVMLTPERARGAAEPAVRAVLAPRGPVATSSAHQNATQIGP